MMTFTAEEKFKCAAREAKMRLRVYPRLVEKGQLTEETSKREIALMAAIVEDYRALAAEERLI